MSALINLLPDRLDNRVRTVAWLNLIGNVLIIGTGGAVRLTGSGLGCSTWPMCTSSSWIPTGESGFHGVIEFSNRMMSPVLAILAVLAVLAVWRLRDARGDLWIHSWIILGGIVVQAVIGGITVWTSLNAWIVGAHYVLSALLVAVATSMVIRTSPASAGTVTASPSWLRLLGWAAALLALVVVFGGVLTTANGPHSGDAGVDRNTAAWEALTHVHAWLAYALCAVLIAIIASAVVLRKTSLLVVTAITAALVAVQAAIGIAQARMALPPLLVGTHMVLAAVTVAMAVVLFYQCVRPNDLAARHS